MATAIIRHGKAGAAGASAKITVLMRTDEDKAMLQVRYCKITAVGRDGTD